MIDWGSTPAGPPCQHLLAGGERGVGRASSPTRCIQGKRSRLRTPYHTMPVQAGDVFPIPPGAGGSFAGLSPSTCRPRSDTATSSTSRGRITPAGSTAAQPNRALAASSGACGPEDSALVALHIRNFLARVRAAEGRFFPPTKTSRHPKMALEPYRRQQPLVSGTDFATSAISPPIDGMGRNAAKIPCISQRYERLTQSFQAAGAVLHGKSDGHPL